MKKIFLLIYLLLPFTATAQKQGQALIDSLVKKLQKAREDTNKIKLLNAISYNCQMVHSANGIQYSRQALVLSKKLNWQKGIATAENNIGLNYNVRRESDTALFYFNSAIKKGNRLNDQSIFATSLLGFGGSQHNLSDYPKALEYFLKALSIFKQTGDTFMMGISMLAIGSAYAYTGTNEYDKALDYLEQAKTIGNQLGNEWLNSFALNVTGIVEIFRGSYEQGNDNFLKSLKISERYGFWELAISSYQCVGICYISLGDYPKAIEYSQKSLQIGEKISNNRNEAFALANIGIIYSYIADYTQAMQYFEHALKCAQEIKNKSLIGGNLTNIGDCYEQLSNYSKALAYYHQARNVFEQLNDKTGIALSVYNIGHVHQLLKEYEQASVLLQRALLLCHEIDDKVTLNYLYVTLSELCLQASDAVLVKMNINPAEKYSRALTFVDSSLIISLESGDKIIQARCYKITSEIYGILGNAHKSFTAFKKYISLRDSTLGEDRKKGITRKQMQFDFDKKQLADSLLNADAHKLAALTLQKQKSYTYAGFAGAAMLLLLSFFIFKNYNTQKRSNKLLSVEKHKSEILLLNILPAEVADELKETGSAAAKHFDEVTVLFTDFVNFTSLAETLKPQQLVDELHACFKSFDDIISKHGIEKIKTIGDAYLAVAGLPIANSNHAANIVAAAIEIKDFMLARRKELGSDTFEIRIGVHSGSVVAGIVGVKKFAYDIWGDTVNTAARMEQNSEAGKINISQTTYQLVKEKCNCNYRGEIQAKNKGALKMYFVE